MSEKKKTLKLEDPFGYAKDCAGEAIGKYVRAMGYVEAVIRELLPNHDPLSMALFDVQSAVNKIIGFVVQCGIAGVTIGVQSSGAERDDGTLIERDWQ